MADVAFTGFVEEVLEGRNGPYGIKVAEPHRKKVDEKWVTTARTFHRVTGAFGATIPWHQFSKGDRVDVNGKQLTETFEKKDGSTGYALIVKAGNVSFHDNARNVPVEAPEYAPWGAPNDDTPF